ncbi:hypothetical protein Taro_008581 [Colocasia esculenta]|uniref:Uncharacterized protein n=1 Tax=Colocasia esculenta TaxID=4460 RepID=A0A843TXY4_COLES|nr:hypothetical protein [Colocasia esculenta]
MYDLITLRLKTPPATPLFPSLEMEANNPNVILQREITLDLQHPGPSRFAGKREEPRPSSRQKYPAAPSSTSSYSRTTNPAPTAKSTLQTSELKREAERRRAGRPSLRRREEIAAANGINRGAEVGKLVLGSRMVEKVVNARRAATAAGGGGQEKGVQPKGGGLEGPPGRHGSLPPQSSHDMVVKHTVAIRKKPAGYVHQKQEQGCPRNLTPKSNRSAPAASTSGETPGHESKEDRSLLKKGTGRRRYAMC